LAQENDMIRILYFGHLPDTLGRSSEEFELPRAGLDVAGLMRLLSLRGEAWTGVFGHPGSLKVTVNKQFAEPDTPVPDGAEVAFVAFVVG
jgi:molybdopterin converting factor small subunit